MRIRSIKPEFWSHPVLARQPPEVQLLALAILCHADDEGYFNADPSIVRGACMPYVDSIPKISGWIRDLSRIRWIEVSEHPEYGQIGHVVAWTEHQRLDHPKPSKIKKYWNTENFGMRTEKSGWEQGSGNRDQGTGIREQGAISGKTSKARNYVDESTLLIPSDLQSIAEHIKEFVLYRKEDLRKPFTPRAYAQFLNQVKTLSDQRYDIAQLVSKAIASGWKTIYAGANDARRPETQLEAAERIAREVTK